MNETYFYQQHVRKMSGILHLERIESSVGTGFPDISAAGDGKQMLIETKVAKGEWLYFERFQLSFHKKRMRYTDGKGVFVLAMCENDTSIILWNSADVVKAPREPYKKWNRVKVSDIQNELMRIEGKWPRDQMQSMARLIIKES